jgi:hypothetical protein
MRLPFFLAKLKVGRCEYSRKTVEQLVSAYMHTMSFAAFADRRIAELQAENKRLMQNDYKLSDEEKAIIDGAVRNADTFGGGRLSYAKRELEEAGYPWRIEYDSYISNLR